MNWDFHLQTKKLYDKNINLPALAEYSISNHNIFKGTHLV